MSEVPSPSDPIASRAEVFLTYLDYFRECVISRVESLTDADQRASRLASEWTPRELLRHLRYVEMRWLEWGFEGREVEHPWGDRRDNRWFVGEDEAVADLVAELRAQGKQSTAIVRAHELEDLGRPGPRWQDPEDPPNLERILFHLLQEYARHAGHLDVVAELAAGETGE